MRAKTNEILSLIMKLSDNIKAVTVYIVTDEYTFNQIFLL